MKERKIKRERWCSNVMFLVLCFGFFFAFELVVCSLNLDFERGRGRETWRGRKKGEEQERAGDLKGIKMGVIDN